MIKAQYLIIGNGVSGMHGAYFIRKLDRKGNITILTNEATPFYSRPLIIDVMTGKKRKDDLILLDEKKHNIYGFDLKKDVTVFHIDTKKRQAGTSVGDVKYEKLLIATGALPKKTNFERDGIFYLRTADDAERIGRYLKKVKKAIVYGGGPIGIKTVYGLLSIGIHVDVIVSSSHILSRALDRKASICFQEIFEKNGVSFYCNREIKDIIWKRGLKGIVTNRGEEIPGDIVITGKGVKPDIGIAQNAGIMTDKGIIVDDTMRTNIDNIFAAGDAAQASSAESGEQRVENRGEKKVVSLWHVGASQGKTAGYNMAGQSRIYEGSVSSNSVEYFGVKCISMGIVEGEGYEEIVFEEGRIYKKYLFNGETLVGAVLLDNIEGAGLLLNAIRTGIPVKNSILQMHNTKSAICNEVNMEVLF
jgi:nitrite reductase (NADH) large subunit